MKLYEMVNEKNKESAIYGRSSVYGEVKISRTPFDGAKEIDVISEGEFCDQLKAYFDANDIYWSVDGCLSKWLQNGDGPFETADSEFDKTYFSVPYCSQDEEILRKCFYGDNIVEYTEILSRDDDGLPEDFGERYFRFE